MKGWMRTIRKIKGKGATSLGMEQKQYREYCKARDIIAALAISGVDIWMVEKNKLKMTVTDGEVTTGIVFDLKHKGQNYYMVDEPNQ